MQAGGSATPTATGQVTSLRVHEKERSRNPVESFLDAIFDALFGH
jgi:hypothetical protein